MIRQFPIDKITMPIQRFISQEKTGGIVLGINVLLAMILANSPLADEFLHFFEHELGFYFDGEPYLYNTLHHWINDGLMAIFFFVVGLELKREIVGGELSEPRNAILPIGAALGGMLFPALIYLMLNPAGEVQDGWGIPMATDIAFALGVMALLGKRVPLALKIFLVALAIVDDLGAVLVIAFFYTSDISFINLLIGLGFIAIMTVGNLLGVRSILFYALIGIPGVWVAFLLSGVHATIAAVLAAFTIPANVRITEDTYVLKIKEYLSRFKALDTDNESPTLTSDQLHVLEYIKTRTNQATPPLQRLEHAMHPMVTFIVLPLFALANAGVSLNIDVEQLFSNNVALGIALGLVVGKVVGIVGVAWALVKFGVAPFPEGMNLRTLFGVALLAAIGFTMSLFITSLAFADPMLIMQAKIAIFTASLVGGVGGYFILLKNGSKPKPEG